MAIKIEGADELVVEFEKLIDGDALKKAMAKACALVEGEARKKAPKDNGELRRSIESRVDENGGEIVGVVSTPLEYAPYVEFGTGLFAENGDGRKEVPWVYQDDKGEWYTTRGQHPQPFLRPALNDNRENIIRILKGGINND